MIPLKPSQSVANLQGDGGGSVERALIDVGTPNLGTFGHYAFVFVDGATLSQAEYMHWVLPNGDKVAAWFDIDNDGTPPTGAMYLASDIKVEVDVLSTDNGSTILNTVLAALQAAPSSYAGMSLLGGSTVSLTDELLEVLEDAPLSKLEDDSGAGHNIADLYPGELSPLQNTYFLLENADEDQWALWINVNGQGSAPSVPGATMVEVAVDAQGSKADLLEALVAAADGLDDFSAQVEDNKLRVNNLSDGNAADVDAGDSGFDAASKNGSAEKYTPAMSTSSILNDPEAY